MGPFTVNVPEAPVFTAHNPTLIATTGQACGYTFVATGNPTPAYALATGAPGWMAINAVTCFVNQV